MERRGVPWLVALLAVLAVGQGPRLLVQPEATAGDTQAKGEEKNQEKTPPAPLKPESPESAALVRARAEPLRLVRELLGLPPAAIPGSDDDLTLIAGELEKHGVVWVVALVPDPVDSNLAANFDQAIDAIQAGCAEAGFLLERLWLPWTGEWAKQQVYRSVPGVLLLRGSKPGHAHLVVLLVGETPKQGVHKEAFRAALSIAAQLQPAGDPVRILGPTFSGSASSLRLALERMKKRPKLEVVSGSATASDEIFAFLGPGFSRTVVPDDRLQSRAYRFLTRELGWRWEKMALLTEFDTVYGREAGGEDEPDRVLAVKFPSGLGSVRSAWEKSEKQRAADADKQNPLKVPRSALELSLADESKPVDIVPQFSSLTAASKDLVLANLLDDLWRSGIRYVGILSTDVRDKLYLAQRVRTFAPDMVLFTIDNNLVYAHPQYTGELDGAVVISSFPLVTESEAWKPLFWAPSPGARYRRQFASELQEGIYLATLKLLGQTVPEPRGWIAAVGNGALWPIANFPSRAPRLDPASGRGDLQILLLAAILCLAALWLRQVYPPAKLRASTHLAAADRAMSRRLLGFGSAVLCLLGGVLVVVGTVPNWSGGVGMLSAKGLDLAYELLYLAALTAGYLFLIWNGAWLTGAAQGPPSAGSDATQGRPLLWSVAGLLLLLPLGWLLHRLWMPGGAELFFLRARRLSSGLSPLVSLGLLGGALYSWVLMELKRRRLVARHLIEWPLREQLEPPLVGTREIAKPVGELLRQTFPTPRRTVRQGLAVPLAAEGRWFWSALALVLVPPGLMLLRVVQPICEPRGYGMIFLALAIFAFALGTVSFHQFFALWLNLDRLLSRLDHTRLVPAFRAIHDEVAWSPMRGFGWSLPGFKMVALSAERLQKLPVSDDMKEEALQELGKLFKADLADDLSAETQARTRLNHLFAKACDELAPRSADEAVEQFFALRLVVFLRPVISHMRNCLAASLLVELFLLYAVSSYAFEPKWFISLGLWVGMGIGVVVTLYIFVQLDRNVTMSAIAKTTAGEISFDRHFYLNLFTYGVVPLAGILVTQFPAIGRFLTGWLNPLLRLAAS